MLGMRAQRREGGHGQQRRQHRAGDEVQQVGWVGHMAAHVYTMYSYGIRLLTVNCMYEDLADLSVTYMYKFEYRYVDTAGQKAM